MRQYAITFFLVSALTACGYFTSKENSPQGPDATPTASPTSDNSIGETPTPTRSPTTEPSASPSPTQSPDVTPTPDESPIPGTPTPEETPAPPVGLSYEDVKAVINKNCVEGCHMPGGRRKKTPLTTLEEIKKVRVVSFRRVDYCTMPPDDEEFCGSEDGKKLMEWLKTGIDLPPFEALH